MNRKAIIAVVALLIANNSVRANDTDGVVLRYGETISAGYGSGNQILTPYVTFPADRIKAFADRGCSVSAVRIGLAKAATNVTVYLKHHATDRRPFYSQKVGSLKAGWNTVQLTSPQVLTAEPLCVGYKATFAEAGGAAYDSYVSTQADTVLVNTKLEVGDHRWIVLHTADSVGRQSAGELCHRRPAADGHLYLRLGSGHALSCAQCGH